MNRLEFKTDSGDWVEVGEITQIALPVPTRLPHFFRLQCHDGDYTDFNGMADLNEPELSIVDVEIVERGNIFDKQGAD